MSVVLTHTIQNQPISKQFRSVTLCFCLVVRHPRRLYSPSDKSHFAVLYIIISFTNVKKRCVFYMIGLCPLKHTYLTEIIYLCRCIMEQNEKLRIEEDIVKMLKTVYDPELPVDVYSLGLIYRIDLNEEGHVDIDMTLTAPNCPIADFIFEDVRQKVESVDGVTSATINLVFEPEWDPRMMTDEAKLELGMM